MRVFGKVLFAPIIAWIALSSQLMAASEVPIALVEEPPKIDGVINPGEWDNASRFEIAYQMDPISGEPGTERTIAYLMYDAENLYVAFRAYDSNPAAIRAPLSRRDAITPNDDLVSIWLDTFDDRKRAYAFRFNPLGIQEDGIFSEGDRSLNWDGVLESKGTIDDEGYTVEARIPFKTLRYAINQRGTWGLHLFRSIARKKENISWMPISRERQNIFLQMGTIGGLDGIARGRTLELIPTIVASSSGTREHDAAAPMGIRFNNVNRVEPGLTAVYQLSPSLTLAATVNPDFSQIEADATQITVNQRFPLFFEEKRPFFLEGSESFRPFYAAAPMVIDTRQIVDPDWGIKLTGRAGRNSIGILAASDRAPGMRVSPSDPDFRRNALFVIARYTRELRSNFSVGGSVTDRRFGRSSNTVGTFDGSFRFNDRQYAAYQLSYSKTTLPTGETLFGGASYAAYNFNDSKWDFVASDTHVAKEFRAQAGFIRRTGYARTYSVLGRSFRPKQKSWWVRVRPFVVGLALRNEQRKLDESFFDPGIDMTFSRGISFYTYWSTQKDNFLGQGLRTSTYNGRWLIDTFKILSASGNFEIGTGPNFDPSRIEIGRLFNNRVTLIFRPTANLSSVLNWSKSSLKSRVNDERLFDQNVFRNRTVYQFDRFNAVRSIVEYDTLSRRIGLSFLYSYTPRPNSALYLGYGDVLFNGIEPLDGRRLPGVRRASRSFFAKASYNFRF